MSIRTALGAAGLAAALVLLFACQTQEAVTLADAPEPNAIKAGASGFSPTGDPATREMHFGLVFGNRDKPQLWSVEIVTGSVTVKKFEGSGSGDELPAELAWNGRAEGGALWPEGAYYAILNVSYDDSYYPRAVSSDRFFLVSTPPKVSLGADPPEFTPAGRGMAGPVSISIKSASALARISGWDIAVRDAGGSVVKSFEGKTAEEKSADEKVDWDGSIEPEGFAAPSDSYTAFAQVRDEYGNLGRASLAIAVRDQVAPPETSLIETESRGFSPTSDRSGGVINLSLKLGNKEALRSWKVEIVGPRGVRKSYAGEAQDAPASLAWDGRDDSGTASPEGSYSALLTADYGRTFKAAQARSKDFILSSTPADCRLTATPESFVPSEKGVSAPVALLLSATPHLGRIESWSLDILDSQGKTVRVFSLAWPTNQALWDGMTTANELVETGARYLARATIIDEFGNKATTTTTVSVKDIPPPTELSVIEPRSSGFSPTGVGKPRSMDFILLAGNAAQMKGWRVAISHAERGTQRVFSGTAADLRRSLSWDGKTERGAFAPDGSYFALLSLDYGKSFRSASFKSAAFALQSAPPDASLELSPAKLTPRAGSFLSPVSIDLRASSPFAEIESWIVSVLDPKGTTVALFKDVTPGGRVGWDGRTSSGALAEPSTTYSVLAEVRDSFGNTGFARALIPVDDLPQVSGQNAISPSANGFAPSGDGSMASIDLRLSVPNREAVKSWKVVIAQVAGADAGAAASGAAAGAQKTFSGDGASLRESLTWAGRDDSGTPSPEGVYTAEMNIDYGATFKSVTVTSRRFVLDSTPPKGTIQIGPELAVPDERGLVAPATIVLDGSSALARMATWKLSISDATGKDFGSYEGAWPPRRIAWNGVAADGSLAEPGAKYTVTALVRDEFGISDQLGATIAVGPLPQATEPSSVASLAKGFSPMGNGSLRFSLAFGNKNLVKGWSLDIERDDRTLRMSFPGDPAKLPDSFAWNGLLQDGTLAPDGLYTAALSIDYGRVYAPAAVASEAFALVATAPAGSISIEPPLFSPDGSGTGDTVAISLGASSRYAKVNDWSLDILDPGGNSFASFRGQWPMKKLAWNGRNAKNELVESAEDYPVTARIRDEFGNTRELKSAVRVDILIVKLGDGYRIRIASIVFKPFTADYLAVAPDIAERNVSTLNLLADKLKKFPGYQIRMVGHAVMVNWDNPALGKAEQEKELLPLSKARAAAIMQALETRGIEAARMVTDGVGASEQIVPDSDFANRWKNRRVEFFLQKK